MLHLLVSVHLVATSLAGSLEARLRRLRADGGQSTAEYALVLLGAAGVALLLVAWATKTGKVTRLLDAVLNRVLDQVG